MLDPAQNLTHGLHASMRETASPLLVVTFHLPEGAGVVPACVQILLECRLC